MFWFLYIGIPVLAIVLCLWFVSKLMRKWRDDDDGDDSDFSKAPVPLSPRPKTKSASAIVDPPEIDEDEEP